MEPVLFEDGLEVREFLVLYAPYNEEYLWERISSNTVAIGIVTCKIVITAISRAWTMIAISLPYFSMRLKGKI